MKFSGEKLKFAGEKKSIHLCRPFGVLSCVENFLVETFGRIHFFEELLVESSNAREPMGSPCS